MMFVVSHTGRHEHVGIQEIPQFPAELPCFGTDFDLASCSMSSLTLAVVIVRKITGENQKRPLRTSSPPASVAQA